MTATIKLRDLLFMWSRDKHKNLYLPFCNTYGHQNSQSNNLRWEKPNFKVGSPTYLVRWPFYHVVTWQIENIWTSTITMATKLKRVAIMDERPHTPNHITFWSHKKSFIDKHKQSLLYLHFCNIYGYQTWMDLDRPHLLIFY